MDDVTRREFVGVSAGALRCSLTIDGELHNVECEPRVTLLDLLRDRLHLTGTKKGCDHGQCGACAVLVNGVRMNSFLVLAVAQDGFRTSGQICSALGMLKKWRSGAVSSVTAATFQTGLAELNDSEIRERMAGNAVAGHTRISPPQFVMRSSTTEAPVRPFTYSRPSEASDAISLIAEPCGASLIDPTRPVRSSRTQGTNYRCRS